jgi:hypothetical protein
MKKLLFALAGLTSLTAPSVANATATITYVTSPVTVPTSNDFKADLAGLGLTQYVTTTGNIILNSPASLTFFFLGSESAFNDTFSTGNSCACVVGSVSSTETTGFTNNFPAGVNIGSIQVFGSGISLAGILNFSSSGPGAPGTVGTDSFGILLPANYVSGTPVNDFYIAYDDQITNQDDNHDDFIVHVVLGAVPEPATWGMMLLGFAGIGMAVRRQRKPALAQIA